MRNGLPEGYTRLEYLQSTGTQYIDTGYVMTAGRSSTFSGNIMWTDKNASANFFYGYRSVNQAEYHGDMRAFFIYGGSATPIGRLAIRYGVNTDNSTNAGVSLNTKCNISWDGLDLKVDGVTYTSLTDAYTPANYQSMWLFWCNCTGYYSADVGHFVGRIYNWQIKDDGIVVRDFVPALDPSNKPCMYDLVTKQPYYNLASGDDFSYGKQLTPVEYIANTDSQYINTGYNPNNTTRVEAKFKMNESPTGFKWLFLSRPENVAGGGFGFGCITNGFISSEFNNRTSSSTDKLIADTYYIIDKNRNLCTYNDKTLENTNSTFTVNYPLPIFALNNIGTIQSGTLPLANCYYFRIYDNDILVRDFIPVRDENNVGYMLDLLTNTLYANAGSGSFAIGEDDLVVRNIGKTNFFKQTTRDIPKGFQEVEYLESTGTQYIDTGVSAKTGLTVESRAKYVSNTGILCGAITTSAGNGDRFYAINFSQQNKVAFTYLDSAFSASTNLVAGSDYTIKTVLGATRQEMFVDGVSKGYTAKTDNVDLNFTLGLFALHRGGTFNPEWYSEVSAIVYYFKIWDGETLVRDFVPYLDASGKPCLWDRVGKKAYYNLGTGEFNYGRKIIPVEYLQSTSGEYIDTGITGSLDIKATIDAMVTEYSENSTSSVFGYASGSTGISILLSATSTSRYSRFSDQTVIAKNLDIVNQRTTISIDKYDLKVGDTTLSFNATNTFTTPSLYLFKISGVTDAYYSPMRIYSCQIKDNGVLVRDFIPAIDENGVGYMFDKVTHSAFLNVGTGAFLYGNPVGQRTETLRILPFIRHIPVNYLEGTGTQYVNTGLVSTADSKVDVSYGFTTMEGGAVNNCAIFGGRNNTTSATFTLFKLASATPQYFRFDYLGQPTIGTASQLTWDTTSIYRFQYNGSSYTTSNVTTNESTSGSLAHPSSFTKAPICLFCVNYDNTSPGTGVKPEQFMKGRIYHYWYTDGTTTIDLYPVLKLPEMTPCFYDRVSKTYFYNGSTDPFLYG